MTNRGVVVAGPITIRLHEGGIGKPAKRETPAASARLWVTVRLSTLRLTPPPTSPFGTPPPSQHRSDRPPLARAMFTTKLSRAAPRATVAALSSSSSVSSTAAVGTSASQHQATRCLATHRPSAHQRRHSSSSKPDSAASGKPAAPAAANKGKADASSAAPVPAENQKERKRSVHRRPGGMTAPGKRKEGVDQFAGLPSVPSLQGLDTAEGVHNLSIASFFSLHRPISLTTPIPPIVSEKTFSSIFEERSQQDPWQNGNSAEQRPEDIIITLNNTIEMLEGNQNQAENDGVRWEVLNESSSNSSDVKHLDGAPQQQPRVKSLDELVANFRPFRAPPPPEPFDEKYVRSPSSKKQAGTNTTVKKARKATKQKVYVTEIRVTESTDSNGRKTYAASSTPIRRLEEQQQQTSISLSSPVKATTRHVSLERRRQRSERAFRDELARIRTPMFVKQVVGMGRKRNEKWVLISVKRQRKLKMKKHKHKKLMKRTRNLRRRLGRT